MDDFFSFWEFLADVFASGFAVVDWFLTCLSSVTRAFCLSSGNFRVSQFDQQGSFPHLAVLEAFQLLDLVFVILKVDHLHLNQAQDLVSHYYRSSLFYF